MAVEVAEAVTIVFAARCVCGWRGTATTPEHADACFLDHWEAQELRAQHYQVADVIVKDADGHRS